RKRPVGEGEQTREGEHPPVRVERKKRHDRDGVPREYRRAQQEERNHRGERSAARGSRAPRDRERGGDARPREDAPDPDLGIDRFPEQVEERSVELPVPRVGPEPGGERRARPEKGSREER